MGEAGAKIPEGLTRQEFDRNILAIAYDCKCSVNDVFLARADGCVSLESFKQWVANRKKTIGCDHKNSSASANSWECPDCGKVLE